MIEEQFLDWPRGMHPARSTLLIGLLEAFSIVQYSHYLFLDLCGRSSNLTSQCCSLADAIKLCKIVFKRRRRRIVIVAKGGLATEKQLREQLTKNKLEFA